MYVCLSVSPSVSQINKTYPQMRIFNTESQNIWLSERSKTITNLKQYHNFRLERGWTANGHEGSYGGGG